jgi:anti-sigma28 factor (negative regulator of flagellin synthesis)
MDMPNTSHLRCLAQNAPVASHDPTRGPIPEARSQRSDLEAAVQPIAPRAEVDWYRVALFREAIASGTYDLRPYRVAASLIRFESSLCSRRRPRAIGGPVVDYGKFSSAQDLLDRIYVLLCEESNHLGGQPAPATPGPGEPEARTGSD